MNPLTYVDITKKNYKTTRSFCQRWGYRAHSCLSVFS